MGLVVVIIIGVGLAAGYLGLADGGIQVNTGLIFGGLFVAGVLFVFGGVFSRNHSQDRDTNGEIEQTLQAFCNERTRLIYAARNGFPTEASIEIVNQREKDYRATIEYGVVTDGAENYYSYKAAK